MQTILLTVFAAMSSPVIGRPFLPPTAQLVAARRRVSAACDALAAAENTFRIDKSREALRAVTYARRVYAAAITARAVLDPF